jgi:hypothetical protein
MSTRPPPRISCLLLLLLALSAGAARASAPTGRGRGDGRTCVAAPRGPMLRADAAIRAPAELPAPPFVASGLPTLDVGGSGFVAESIETHAARVRAFARSPLPRSPPLRA